MTPSTPPLQHDHFGSTSPLAQYLADAERSFDSISPSPPLPHGNGTIHGSKHSTRYGHGVTRRGRGGSRSGSQSPAAVPPPERLDSLAITPSQWADMPSPARTPSPSGASGSGAHPRTHHSPNPKTHGTGSSPSRTRAPSLLDDGFAEKFRYLIASSGLLEKTQIATQTVPSAPESEADAAEEYLPPPASTGWWLPESLRSDDGIRYDFIAAIALILAGMIYMLGPTTVLVPSAAVAAGYTFLMPQGVRLPATTWELTPQPTPPISPPPKQDPAPTQDAPISPVEGTGPAGRMMASLETLLSESQSLDKSIASSLQLLAPRPDDTEQAHELRITIHRIMDDMTDSLAGATSALIPMADRSELAVLGNMYDIPVLGQRRQNDSTSEDDDNESPSVRAARRTRPRASSSFAALAPPLEHKRDGLLSAHERSYAESPIRAPAPQDPDDRFTKLPERNRPRHKRSSWSTDWNTPPPLYRSGHEVHGNNTADEDQGATESVFSATSTESSSMPASIPDNQAAHLMPAFSPTPTPPASRQQAQVFSPKRTSPLTQALERLEGASLPRVPRATPPSSFSRPGQSFYRRSLQDIPYIASPPTTTQDHAASMAMARASSAMSSANRRSLQYNGGLVLDNAREELVTPSTLSRAASLNSSSKRASLMEPLVPRSKPSSKRASLGVDRRSNASSSQRTSLYEPRIQASSSRRSSLLYPDYSGSERNTPPKRTSLLFTDALRSQLQVPDASSLGYGIAPYRPTMQRVTSVSPLTLQGLKASYLGVHLKRRRVACCLLGLRFGEPLSAESYWSAVIRAMRSLAEAMGVARGKLEAIRSEVERDVAAAAALAAVTSLPHGPHPRSAGLRPTSFPSSAGLGRDYAPRDSAEQALFTSVDELQHALARVWARCDEVRTRTAAGDTAGAVQTWTDIRADVGGMLRHVERGRDALARVGGQDPDERDGDAGDNSMDGDDGRAELADRELPEFLRAWVERQPEREEIERHVNEPPQPADEPALPPPGVDEVYEATLPPAEPKRSTQSREERIALARQARAKGLTVAEMQALAAESPEVRRAREAEEDRRRAEGRVLVELEGVFGEIRRRKGVLPSETEQDGQCEPHPSQVRRVLQSEEVGIAL